MAFKLYSNKSSLDQKLSRQVIGGTIETDGIFLGWWNKKVIPRDDLTDIEFEIPTDLAYRADKISYRVYNRDDYQWLILQYNNIVDVNEELYPGAIIYVPSYNRVIYDISIKK